jgi:hypothetical protein
VEAWRGVPVDRITKGRSAAYLRESDQLADLDFILAHVDDVPRAFLVREREVIPAPDTRG